MCYNYLRTQQKGGSAMLTKSLAILVHLFSCEGALVKKIREVNQKRVAYWQLQNLSDKTLKDMGIHRSQIKSIVYHE